MDARSANEEELKQTDEDLSSSVFIYLCLYDKCSVSSDGNLLLHDAEAVKSAEEQAGAVQPQGEVHVVTGEAILVVLDVLTPVDVEEEEVMEVTSGERLLLFVTFTITCGKMLRQSLPK